ncbi:hypothetical protein K3495_g6986 [Podosphaera aphanis]|nr:hypothetical protein K3495_g6986 [Podosphaera aphanis]
MASALRIFLRPVRSSLIFRRSISALKDTSPPELGVGEIQDIAFKIEPLRRTGEDANTMRARILYQCRKRGTLESDLLMSTFAEAHLRDMNEAQLAQFDLFLDENDWDIYYWATQKTPAPQELSQNSCASSESAATSTFAQETSSPMLQTADPVKKSEPKLDTDEWRKGAPRSGEWAQTVGRFKPAYRPVPARWRNSEILAMLRRHVLSRSAGGIHDGEEKVASGGGMAFMPPIFQTDK